MGGGRKGGRKDLLRAPRIRLLFELRVISQVQPGALEQEASYRKGQVGQRRKKNSGRVCKACISEEL